jgi:hypothetical protein
MSSNASFVQKKTTFLKARKGIAFTNSGNKIRFKKVRETENSFIFTTMNKTDVEIDKFKITKIDRRNGTKGFRYAISSIGVTTLIVIHSYYMDEYLTGGGTTYEGEIATAPVLLSILTGTLGGIIGLTQKRYKTIYTSPSFGNYEPKLKLKTTAPNAIPSLTLSYTF